MLPQGLRGQYTEKPLIVPGEPAQVAETPVIGDNLYSCRDGARGWGLAMCAERCTPMSRRAVRRAAGGISSSI